MFSGSSLLAKLSLIAAIIIAGAVLALGISRETPVGSLKGRVVAQESGAPIPAGVCLVSEPRDDNKTLRFKTRSSNEGTFSFTRVPAGDYKLTIEGNAHHMKGTTVTISEGCVKTIEAELTPDKPSLDLYVHQHVFTPGEKPQVTCKGFVIDADSVSFTLYKVDPDRFLNESGRSLRRLVGGAYGTYNIDLAGNPALSRAAAFSSMITTRDREGIFTQRFDFPVLGPGLYVTQAKAGPVTALDWIMITKLGIITKIVGPDILAYTVDLKTGAPVPDVGIDVYSFKTPVESGKTGPDGLISLAAPSDTQSGERTIVARSGESFAFVTTWVGGRKSAGDVIYSYTDRPVYRPGQRVYFKGIVRRRSNEEYVVPEGQTVKVEVKDSRDNLVYRGNGKTDRFGSYHAYLDLNAEAATGYYTLTTTPEGAARGEESGFRVMSYRKPEFSVKVTFPKKRYLRGQTVKAKVSAQYYFGAPVADAKVNYYVTRSPYWLFGNEDDMYGGYEDYGGYGESVIEGEIRTDSNGEAVVEFPADWPMPDKDDPYDTDQLFSIDAYVTDQSDQSADGSGSVLATRGEFAIYVTPDRYVAEPGGKVTADIAVHYYNNKPVANQRVKVVVGRDYWHANGEIEFNVFKRFTVTTDRAGRASVTFAAREGSLRMDAVAEDRHGNTVTSSGYLWCWGAGYGEMEGTRYSDLQIVLDKKTYDPGNTAKVLINTSSPGATALVTVEADRIYYTKTVPLKGNSTTVEIPVKSTYKPNFYVGVCFVKDKKFVSQEARAKVSLKPQELKIDVKPDKRKYRPGEEAVYRLTATDGSGKPAVAQLSVGVVDEAIYAIAPDRTEPILDYFYSHKPNSVSTSFSFPQVYLSDPDKAGSPKLTSDIRIRKRFLDTAYWSPSVVTDSSGHATVRFKMPDNLTTWRATVRGITTSTSCGQTTKNVLAQQPMLVRLETPRFLIQTDKTTITAAVHNYTGETQSVLVGLKAPGLKIDNNTSRRVSVPNDGVQRIDWHVSAPKPGNYVVTVMARDEMAIDAVELPLPVYPHGEQRPSLKVGTISNSGKTSQTLLIRSDAIPEATRLNIRLSPSLASTMLGSLDYLAMYPWGCTEQTTSSFLPDVVLTQSFKDVGVVNPELQKKLPDMVTKGLYRLYRFQLEDGGWTWYEYGKSDQWMTAYVCYGLIRARDAGFPVNPQVLKRGLKQLAKMMGRLTAINNQNAYPCYVFTLSGWDSSKYFERAVNQNALDASGLAYAAISLARTGHMDQAKIAMNRLYGRATTQPGMVYWTHGTWRGDSIEATALALEAALAVDPNDPRVPQIVRWLMLQRTGNYWYSTRQTAEVLYAMAEYLKHSNELAPDYGVVVRVNGTQVGNFRFDKASIFDVDKVINVPAQLLHKGRNKVEIAKSGQGNLYYSMEMTQYLAKKTIPATLTGSGMSVTRAYYQSNRVVRGSGEDKPGPEVSRCETGDIVLVKLTINASKRMKYMLLEDYIPAGFEIIDKGNVDYWEWGLWYSGRDIRDNKIAFFLENVPKGRRVIEYRMRAGFPGVYHAMPAQIYAMYQPDVRASTAEARFEIR